jgi:hypothetical protein
MAITYHKPPGARAEYEQQQRLRVQESPSFADQFPQLKSLTVKLEYHDSENREKRNRLKYMVNLDNVKSVFRFKCPNSGCIRGDFDLTKKVAEAVVKHLANVTGKLSCRGRTTNWGPCRNVLHYTLLLTYNPTKN